MATCYSSHTLHLYGGEAGKAGQPWQWGRNFWLSAIPPAHSLCPSEGRGRESKQLHEVQQHLSLSFVRANDVREGKCGEQTPAANIISNHYMNLLGGTGISGPLWITA